MDSRRLSTSFQFGKLKRSSSENFLQEVVSDLGTSSHVLATLQRTKSKIIRGKEMDQMKMNILLSSEFHLFFPPSTEYSIESLSTRLDDLTGLLSESRKFVIQGENLKFYVIIENVHASEDIVESKNISFIDCFRNCEFDVDILAEETKSHSVIIPFNKFYSQTRPEKITSTQPSHQFIPLTSSKEDQQNRNSNTEEKNLTDIVRPDYKHPHLFKNSKGSLFFIYEIEFRFAVEETHLNKELLLHLIVTPSKNELSSEEEELNRLIDQFYKEYNLPIRSIQRQILITQPFDLSIESTTIDTNTVLNAFFESSRSVIIHDVEVSLGNSENSEIRNYFSVSIAKENMPCHLNPQDMQAFIIMIESRVSSNSDILKRLQSLSDFLNIHIIFVWSMDLFKGKIMSSYKFKLPSPKFEDLIVLTETSSPSLHFFSVNLTVVNLAENSRDLTLILPFFDSDSYSGTAKRFSSSSEDENYSSRETSPIISVEKSTRLGVVGPKSTLSSQIQLLGLKEGIHDFDSLMIMDNTSKKLYVARSSCQFHVQENPSYK